MSIKAQQQGQSQLKQSAELKSLSKEKKDRKQSPELCVNYTFWIQEVARQKIEGTYQSGLKKLVTVSNIRQFWQIFQFFKKTNDLPTNCDIYMFQEGITPEWEDPENVGGGCFKIKIGKQKSNKLWENSVFSLVSPQNKLTGVINGLRIKIKERFDQIEIWLNHNGNQDREKLEQVKAYLKENLQTTDERIFHFYLFK